MKGTQFFVRRHLSVCAAGRTDDYETIGAYQGAVDADGRKCGFGIRTFEDGSRYEGEWHGGCEHGHGDFYRAVKPSPVALIVTTAKRAHSPHETLLRLEYRGDHTFGRRSGTGQLYRYKNISSDAVATVYEGQLVDGTPQGNGVERCADGSIYEGQWDGGCRHGHGQLTTPAGDAYVGGWLGGVKHGGGTFLHLSRIRRSYTVGCDLPPPSTLVGGGQAGLSQLVVPLQCGEYDKDCAFTSTTELLPLGEALQQFAEAGGRVDEREVRLQLQRKGLLPGAAASDASPSDASSAAAAAAAAARPPPPPPPPPCYPSLGLIKATKVKGEEEGEGEGTQ